MPFSKYITGDELLLRYTLTAKMFGAKIFVEKMFGGFFIKSPKISVNNFGEKGF